MVSFQDFKNEYCIANKDLLDKTKPGLRHEMIQKAYMKHYNSIRCKDYYNENKEKVQQKQKEYYEANKQQLQQKQKNKYEENKKEINDKRKEIIECECGCFIQKWHLSRHVKTAKHNELLQNKSDLQPTNQIK